MVSAVVVRSVATVFGVVQDLVRSVAILLGLLQTATHSPAVTAGVVCAACLALGSVACWFREPQVDRTGQGYGPPEGPRTSRGLGMDASERLDALADLRLPRRR